MTLVAVTSRLPTPLPAPTKLRWVPLRSGLLNLYKYDHEEFWFEDGHLLLRGNNGTGKSRVLALQLPFLLDGEVIPTRFEPDGDPAKRMEWNLLMGRHDDRVGYTWIEFGRLTESGAQEFLTLGCGLSATHSQPGVHKWFFTTRQRVGESLWLQGAAGQPLGRDRLKEALGGEGELHLTAQAYRGAVDQHLFHLGPQRYDALVNLLIQLRKPQLSRSLNQQQLASALREALPPLAQSVVDEIGEAFRALEHERSELESFRAAATAVDRFLETYRRYVQIQARQRSAKVRSTHNGYDESRGTLRQAEQQLAAAQVALVEATGELTAAGLVRTAAGAEVTVLQESELWRDAAALEERKSRAQRTEAGAGRAEEELGVSRRDLDSRRTGLDRALLGVQVAQATVTRRQEETRGAAAAAAFESRWPPLEADLLGPLRGEADGEPALERALSDRRRAIGALEKLHRAVETARSQQATASGERDRRQVELEEASSAELTDRRTLEAATGAVLDAVLQWRESLRQLEVEGAEALERRLSAWCDDWTGPFPLESVVAAAHDQVRDRVARERSGLEHKYAELGTRLTDAESRRELLQKGRDLPPPSPHTRSTGARPAEREGAPLWRLCDFHPSVSPTERAGIEAALEAAGLLDAWVGPQGLRLPEGTHDTLLGSATAPPAGAPRLSAWLSVSRDPADAGAAALEDAAIAAVLDSIGGAVGAGEHWVDPSGTFRLGPLTGSHAKQTATYLGSSAREAARRTALERLEAELAELRSDRSRVEARLASLRQEQARAAEEAGAAPGGDRVRSAGHALTRSAEFTRGRRQQVAEAEERLAVARSRLAEAAEASERAARDLGLEAWAGRLPQLETATRELERRAGQLARAVWDAVRAGSERGRWEREVLDADRATVSAGVRAQQAREEATEASSAFQTLQNAVGASVDALSGRLLAAKERLSTAQTAVERWTREHGVRGGGVETAEHRRTTAVTGLDQATAQRGAAIDALLELRPLGFLRLADPTLGAEDAEAWSPTRAVEVARQLEATLASVDHSEEAERRLGAQIHERFQTLNNELGAHGLFHPTIELAGGLFSVRIGYQNGVLGMDEFREVLRDEVLQRGTLLDQRERELLENHLLGEVASDLHRLLHDAALWVQAINEELEKCPTSTGMSLRFSWEPLAEGPPGLVGALKLLLTSQALWSPAQRGAVGEFLKGQIDRVRAEAQEATWQEQLALAFDYRGWHEFSVERHQDGRWQRLTRRTHGTGSGGEKAIALTLPQFAAAAAHYQSAAKTAPRLILLDEAFVGIDSDMRGKCMGLLATFDLDFVMTSEREWGCYATLPGVSICQLTSHPGIDAVHLTRFVWNGRARVPASVVLAPAQPVAPEV